VEQPPAPQITTVKWLTYPQAVEVIIGRTHAEAHQATTKIDAYLVGVLSRGIATCCLTGTNHLVFIPIYPRPTHQTRLN